MTREEVMKFFRSDDLLDNLSNCDKEEIALACVSFSDKIYNGLCELYREEESENE